MVRLFIVGGCEGALANDSVDEIMKPVGLAARLIILRWSRKRASVANRVFTSASGSAAGLPSHRAGSRAGHFRPAAACEQEANAAARSQFEDPGAALSLLGDTGAAPASVVVLPSRRVSPA